MPQGGTNVKLESWSWLRSDYRASVFISVETNCGR